MKNLDFQFLNVPHSKPIKSYVLRQVNHWLKNHQISLDKGDEEFQGKILLFRDPASQGVQCEIEFQTEKEVWKNVAVDKGLNGAVDQCLRRLNRVARASFRTERPKTNFLSVS